MRPAPGPVWAAAIITWVASGVTVVVTVIVAALTVWIFSAMGPYFDGGLRAPTWAVVTTSAVIVAISALSDWCAWLLVRGRARAWRPLMVLSLLLATLNLVGVYYVVPLVFAAAGVAVVVLLLVPVSQEWLTGRDVIRPGSPDDHLV